MTEEIELNPHETLPDLDALEKLRDAHARVREQIHAVVVGQDDVIDELMAGIFAGGHCILESAFRAWRKLCSCKRSPRASRLEFGRIQFTPDLMPADITGTEVIYDDRQSGHREFRFVHGPIFTNLLLADEINRTPPKTQAALLEAMQERHVSSGTKRIRCRSRSLCWPRRIRSSRRGPIRSPRRSSTVS